MINQMKLKEVEKELLNRVSIENKTATKETLQNLDTINSLAFYQCGILLNNEEILTIQNNCLNELAAMKKDYNDHYRF